MICLKHERPYDVAIDCRKCRGDGAFLVEEEDDLRPNYVRCWVCGGNGAVYECEMCLLEV